MEKQQDGKVTMVGNQPYYIHYSLWGIGSSASAVKVALFIRKKEMRVAL